MQNKLHSGSSNNELDLKELGHYSVCRTMELESDSYCFFFLFCQFAVAAFVDNNHVDVISSSCISSDSGCYCVHRNLVSIIYTHIILKFGFEVAICNW